jgi:hypothetical protein
MPRMSRDDPGREKARPWETMAEARQEMPGGHP